ncbi:OmpA family protein [Geitlerinema splendidum]|nr:OmpA family protein [Geitlerinema splendidum]
MAVSEGEWTRQSDRHHSLVPQFLIASWWCSVPVKKPVTESKPPQKIPPPSRSGSAFRQVLIILFRLLLLGVGGGLAFFVGVAIAHFYPASNPQEPLFERIRRSSPDLLNRGILSNPAASQIATQQASPQLTAQQQQTLQAELQQLQAQYQQLLASTAALETQFGTANSDRPLEVRLQQLSEALGRGKAVQTPAKFFVTLPSDVLFSRNESLLREDILPVLDNIVVELQNHPQAAVRIAAHTDNTSDAETNQILSLERAQAVQQYLTDRLNTQYRWTTIGFGETRPLVDNDTEVNRQRNRRIEISID